MLNVVIGFALLTTVERISPIAPNSIFSKRVKSDSIKNALTLKGPFFTSSMQINPAREVTRFNMSTLINTTDSLLKKISLRVSGRVSRYSAVLLYSSLSRIFEVSTMV